MPAPFLRPRPSGILIPLGAALALHAALVAAAFLVPRDAVEKLLAGGSGPAVAVSGLEQEVILASPPEEAPPSPLPAEASPSLADAPPEPSPEPPPPPEPEPDFVQPEPGSLAAAEPVAPAVAVPVADIPSPQGVPDDAPSVVIGNAGFPRPDYPYGARARGQEGTVVLALDVVHGAVVGASVVDSSGYPLLDQAAVRCVRARWRFPVAFNASVTQPIRFSLN